MYGLGHVRRFHRGLLALVLGVAVIVIGSGAVSAAGNPNSQVFHSDGAVATVLFQSSTRDAVAVVAQVDTNQVSETVVTYTDIDRLTGQTLQDGTGLIPNSALTVSGNTVRLLVDTSTLPNFTYFSGNGGLLDITWTKNGAFEVTNTGVTETRASRGLSGFHLIQNGTRSFQTADVQGSIFRDAISDPIESDIGTNHNTTITVQH